MKQFTIVNRSHDFDLIRWSETPETAINQVRHELHMNICNWVMTIQEFDTLVNSGEIYAISINANWN